MTKSTVVGLFALIAFSGALANATQNVVTGNMQTTKAALELPLLERLSALKAQPHAYENLKTVMFTKSNSMDLRWKAVTAASRVGTVAQAKADLVRALQSPEWYMRNAGLIALLNVDHSQALTWARKLLSDKALVVRSAAVDVISQSHDVTSASLLWQKLYAKENFRGRQSLFIRRRIVETLGDIEAKGNEGKFVAVLQDNDASLHEPAIEALERLTKHTVGLPGQPLNARRAQWQQWYKTNKATL